MLKSRVRSLLILTIAFASGTTLAKDKDKILPPRAKDAPVILWTKPDDIAARNLLYGAGGKDHEPHGPFTFLAEDSGGTTPKFDVRDADGTKWKVKLGVEAQPEVSATRLAWSVGYFTQEDYLVPMLHVANLPHKLNRGNNLRQPGDNFVNARLKRDIKGMDKVSSWKWMDNPFKTTRELDGLRVVMALINNWDLKTDNNGVFETAFKGRAARAYLVTDFGASFGGTGLGTTHAESKGNLHTYQRSKFITKSTDRDVNFATPSSPTFLRIFIPTEYFSRIGMEKIGRHIPLDHVRWIAQQLAQLSPAQIRDAFRAANYSPADSEAFGSIVQARIADLGKL